MLFPASSSIISDYTVLTLLEASEPQKPQKAGVKVEQNSDLLEAALKKMATREAQETLRVRVCFCAYLFFFSFQEEVEGLECLLGTWTAFRAPSSLLQRFPSAYTPF